MHLQIWWPSTDVQIAQLVYLNRQGSWYPTPLTGRYCTGWVLNGGKPSNIVDSSVYYNANTLLISGNMWYNTKILKIHPNGMAIFKKLVIQVLLTSTQQLLSTTFIQTPLIPLFYGWPMVGTFLISSPRHNRVKLKKDLHFKMFPYEDVDHECY